MTSKVHSNVINAYKSVIALGLSLDSYSFHGLTLIKDKLAYNESQKGCIPLLNKYSYTLLINGYTRRLNGNCSSDINRLLFNFYYVSNQFCWKINNFEPCPDDGIYGNYMSPIFVINSCKCFLDFNLFGVTLNVLSMPPKSEQLEFYPKCSIVEMNNDEQKRISWWNTINCKNNGQLSERLIDATHYEDWYNYREIIVDKLQDLNSLTILFEIKQKYKDIQYNPYFDTMLSKISYHKYQWKINNISEIQNAYESQIFYSKMFMFHGLKWFISFIPNAPSWRSWFDSYIFLNASIPANLTIVVVFVVTVSTNECPDGVDVPYMQEISKRKCLNGDKRNGLSQWNERYLSCGGTDIISWHELKRCKRVTLDSRIDIVGIYKNDDPYDIANEYTNDHKMVELDNEVLKEECWLKLPHQDEYVECDVLFGIMRFRICCYQGTGDHIRARVKTSKKRKYNLFLLFEPDGENKNIPEAVNEIQINYYMNMYLIYKGKVISKQGTNSLMYFVGDFDGSDCFEFNLSDEFSKDLMENINDVQCKIKFSIIDIFDANGNNKTIHEVRKLWHRSTQIKHIVSKLDTLIKFVERFEMLLDKLHTQ